MRSLARAIVLGKIITPEVCAPLLSVPQVSVPVNVGLACVALPVRLGIWLVVAIVLPPNVPLVQVKDPQVRALLPHAKGVLKVVAVHTADGCNHCYTTVEFMSSCCSNIIIHSIVIYP